MLDPVQHGPGPLQGTRFSLDLDPCRVLQAHILALQMHASVVQILASYICRVHFQARNSTLVRYHDNPVPAFCRVLIVYIPILTHFQ